MTEGNGGVDRISSGIPELDGILSGGFPSNSINILMGLPGTGKTILAEQIAFRNATAERPALYLSTLAEPLEKFIVHGQEYGFFDSARIGRDVIYDDLAAPLRDRGLAALTEVAAELVARHRPRTIVIDSFKALMTLPEANGSARQILFDLASLLSNFECTTFLVGEYEPDSVARAPEFAIADTVLQLMKEQSGMREERFLRVEKLRGSGYASGLHAFRIGPQGLTIFPRLRTPHVSPDYRSETERAATGISGLDGMIDKGLWRGTSTLVVGPSGSGKTSLGVHFIATGAKAGEAGLYVGFQENPTQFARALANFDLNPAKLLHEGRFQHLYHSPVEMQLDEVVQDIFRTVRERKVRRVVIDSLGELRRSSIDDRRFMEYMYSLTQWFAIEGVTSVLLQESAEFGALSRLSEEEISNMTDNVILLRLRLDDRMERTLRIIKTRNSAHDHAERVLRITSDGMSVAGPVRPTA